MKKNIILVSCFLIIFLLSFNVVSAKHNSNKTIIKDNTKINNEQKLINSENKVVKITKNDYKKIKTRKSINNLVLKKNIEKNKDSNIVKKKTSKNNNSNLKVILNSTKMKNNNYNFSVTATNSKGKLINKGIIELEIDDLETDHTNLNHGHASITKKINNNIHFIQAILHDEFGNYITKSNILIINVQPVKFIINSPKKLDMSKNLEIKVKITDDGKSVENKGKMTLYLDNKKKTTKTPSNGKVYFILKNNKEGVHSIKISYLTTYKETITKIVKVKITRKKEKINMTFSPDYLETDSKTKLKVKVTNDTKKLNKGIVNLKLNGKKIASKKVKNGLTTFSITMPRNSGKYIFTSEYINNKKIVSQKKTIKLFNSENVYFDNPYYKKITPNSEYTFKIYVLSPNVKVNYGNVKIALNNKTIANEKVKNGLVSVTYRLPNIQKYYDVTASFYKNNKLVHKMTNAMDVHYW